MLSWSSKILTKEGFQNKEHEEEMCCSVIHKGKKRKYLVKSLFLSTDS